MNLLDFLFPKFCISCSRPFTYLCPKCYEQPDFFTLPIEPQLKDNQLDLLLSACVYKPPISNLVKELKYTGIKNIAKTCAQVLYYSVNIPNADIITAVPLHPKRQKQRGYNQAEEIAKHLSILLNIPYLPLLKRTKHTKNQASILDKEKRLSNLKDIFEIDTGIKTRFIASLTTNNQQLTALIIDDITTTGTTLNECAKVLKQHGVKKAIGLTLAHGS